MKRSLSIIMLATLSFSAFAAQTDSDTLLLKGKVAKKVSIVVTPAAEAALLDLSSDQTNLVVASVEERANVNAGYKVTITSANGGKLVNGSDDDYSVAYTLKYNSVAVPLISVTAGDNEIPYTTEQLAPIDRSVTISYLGDDVEDMLAGTYSDTVTFAISAN